MRFSRTKPSDSSANPEHRRAIEALNNLAASQPESTDVLTELAQAEREAEELLEQRRRELEQAQAAEWERWTSQMEANLQDERDRRERLEAALARSESARADAERRAAEANELLSQTRADTEKSAAAQRQELEETRSRLEAKLAESDAQLAQAQRQSEEARRDLEETRARFEAELGQAHQERDQARAELKPRSKRKVVEATSRIEELERQLEAEAHRRADLEVAVELLEKQHAAATERAEGAERMLEIRAQAEQRRRATEESHWRVGGEQSSSGSDNDGQPTTPTEDSSKRWGVPIEALGSRQK
jgi:colicin import membrane protein